MLENKDFLDFVRNTYAEEVIKQVSNESNCPPDFFPLSLNLDLAKLIKAQTQLATSIVSNFPSFMKAIQQGSQEILSQRLIPKPLNGFKIALDIKNCILPKHNIKSLDFLNASLSQKEGILLYLKDAEVLQIHQPELYLQSWTEIWEPQCSCPNSNKTELRAKQSLLDILKQSQRNLKDKGNRQISYQCSQCMIKMKLREQKQEDLTYLSCRKLTLNINPSNQTSKSQIFSYGLIEVYVDNRAINKYKVGEIIDMCCYYKMNVQFIKTFTKMIPEITHSFYLVCSYPQQDYMNSTSSLFLGKLINLELKQVSIFRINDLNNIIYNYKGFIDLINKMKFPYLEENSLTALKMVTINSIFCHQLLNQRLNMLILTDELNLIERSIRINNLNIQKLPSIYDDKTIMTFLHSCHHCILLVVNPDKKDFAIINKLLKKQIMQTLHLTLWVISEPDQNLKKKIELEYFDIILDLTMEKNLNVCGNVYQNLIDKLLNSFLREEQLDLCNILTIPKRKRNYLDNDQPQFSASQEDDAIRQQKIAKDILHRYFLKSRQYKTIKFNNIETITKVSQSFMNFRYFIKNKGKTRKVRKHVSVLDAILTIFVDQETNRNKYSKSNTLFADDISKVMLNQSDCSVSVWEYEYQDSCMQQSKKFIQRDQMVSRVVVKIFSLLYEDSII